MKKQHLDLEAFRRKFVFNPETGLFYRRFSNGEVDCKPAGSVCKNSGYRYLCFAYRVFPASHLVWAFVHGELPEGVVDHINGVRSDDRPANLRLVDAFVNAQNRHGPARNRMVDLPIGVYPTRGGRFKASFVVRGIKHHVGVFDTVDEAESKYLEMRRLFSEGNTL